MLCCCYWTRCCYCMLCCCCCTRCCCCCMRCCCCCCILLSSGPRRRLGQGDRSPRARIPKTPPAAAAAAAAASSGGPRAAEDEEEEGFSSCLFQLSGEEVSPFLREASSERRQKKGDSGMQQADNLSFIQRQRTRRNSPMSRRRQKRQ